MEAPLPNYTFMGPGEDCNDCPWCGCGLHEAKISLVDACKGLNWNLAMNEVALVVSVECPACSKPCTSLYAVSMANAGAEGKAVPVRTKTDEKYLELTRSPQ